MNKEALVPGDLVSLSRRTDNGTRPARIIWLDDERTMIRAGARLLAQHFVDYTLVPCFHGDAALREIEKQPPDLLMTDYHHPGARLAEILQRIGRAPTRFPIMVVSACAANNPGFFQADSSGACPSFTIEVLVEPSCQRLIPAVLRPDPCQYNSLNLRRPPPGSCGGSATLARRDKALDPEVFQEPHDSALRRRRPSL